MPSKKKKFNARFPPARIKKIMQTDEDVGKVAAAVPVLISRALEKFIETLILKTSETTQSRNAKTLSTSHIKQTIHQEKKFDFLKDLVANVPDHQAEEEAAELFVGEAKRQKTPRPRKQRTEGKKKRKKKNSSDSSEEEEANENGSSTETDEESSLHNQNYSPSTSAMVPHQLPVPVETPEGDNSSSASLTESSSLPPYPSTSSMLGHPGYSYPPATGYSPGCYSLQYNNNHMPQQTQPLNLCSGPYNPSMYVSSGYSYPPSYSSTSSFPGQQVNHGKSIEQLSHSAINHSSCPSVAHSSSFMKTTWEEKGQDLSRSSLNPVLQNTQISQSIFSKTVSSVEDDDYDA